MFWLKWDEAEAAARSMRVSPRLIIIPWWPKAWTVVARTPMTPPVMLPAKGRLRFMGIDVTSIIPTHADQPAGGAIKGIGASLGRVGAARVIRGSGECSTGCDRAISSRQDHPPHG